MHRNRLSHFVGALLVLVGTASVALTARAGGTLPAPVLKDIKAATVFVKVEATVPGLGKITGSGSGFLFLVQGDMAYIATNHHVVVPPERIKVTGPPTLVFFSGTTKEVVVQADILATDSSRDLAILRFKSFKDLPKPIAIDPKLEPVETMSVFSFGFPFGDKLSTTKGNPAMTVGKASISSLREDEFGRIKVIQIDGELNPGNSGGPLVDEKGRLVGVAVAKIRETRIGMAIPPGELTRMLEGRVGSLGSTTKKIADGQAEVQFTAELIDPLNKIKEVSLRIRLGASGQALKPGKDGSWPELPGSETVVLTIKDTRAMGTFRLAGKAGDGKKLFTLQTSFLAGDGKLHFTQPGTHEVDFGRSIAAVKPLPGKMPEPKATLEPFADLTRQVGKLTVHDLKVPAKGLLPCMAWSEDGKKVFVLDKEGYLRCITLVTFQEELMLDIGRRCSWLSMSKEGLIVTVPDLQEFWVIDPATLKVKQRVEVNTPTQVVASPVTSVVISVSGDRVRGRHVYSVFDLKAKTSKEFPNAHFKGGAGSDKATMSPDGKYFFTYGGIEQIFRFRVEGLELKLEETSHRIGQNAQSLIVSPDSKYVCLPSGGGNYRNIPDHPEVSTYTTYVYPIDNLRRPAFTVHSDAYPRMVGFDPAADLVYAQAHGHQLKIFTMTGRKLQEHVLGRGDTRYFFAHPEGRRLFVLMADRLAFVQIPEDK